MPPTRGDTHKSQSPKVVWALTGLLATMGIAYSAPPGLTRVIVMVCLALAMATSYLALSTARTRARVLLWLSTIALALGAFMPGVLQPSESPAERAKYSVTRDGVAMGIEGVGISTNGWTDSFKVYPGEVVQLLLKYKNVGTSVSDDVVLDLELPPELHYLPGSAVIGNPSHPRGIRTDPPTVNGWNVGSYNPEQNCWIMLAVQVDLETEWPAGTTPLTIRLTGPGKVQVQTSLIVIG